MRTANNPITRSFWYEERADGSVSVGVVMPNSRMLHDSSLTRNKKSEKTWWCFKNRNLDISPGFMSFESEASVRYGRGLVRMGQWVLRKVDMAIALRKPRLTPEQELAEAKCKIAALEARVKLLEKRRRK